MTRYLTITLLLAATVCGQVEMNDPGGSMTMDGQDPNPALPFSVPANGGTLRNDVGGNPGAAYIYMLGAYKIPGQVIGVLANQVLNLDAVQILGDGIGGTGILPPGLFTLDMTGASTFLFPTNPSMVGQNHAFQAITTDPTLPFNLNLTAAADYAIADIAVVDVYSQLIPTSTFAPGDEGLFFHQVLGGPYTVYGQTLTTLSISSNGWIRFDGNAIRADASPSALDLEDGSVGIPGANPAQAPVLAWMWNDLDFSNTFSGVGVEGGITLTEDFTNQTITIAYRDGGYIGAGPGFGDVTVFMDFSSGVPVIAFDYSGFVNVGTGSSIVGLSDGDTGAVPGADVEGDLVTLGFVNPHVSSGDFETYYQDFTNGFSELEDLGGLIMTFGDQSSAGNGNWLVF